MKMKALLPWLALPCLLLSGCEVVEEQSRAWEPGHEEFVQAVAGNSYSASWETDAEGTRQISISIEQTARELTPEERDNNPFAFAREGLPYRLEIDGNVVEEGLVLLDINSVFRFGESVVEVSLARNGEAALIAVEGEDYHLDNLRFGMGNQGQPTLLEANFQEGSPGQSGFLSMHSVNFVN